MKRLFSRLFRRFSLQVFDVGIPIVDRDDSIKSFAESPEQTIPASGGPPCMSLVPNHKLM